MPGAIESDRVNFSVRTRWSQRGQKTYNIMYRNRRYMAVTGVAVDEAKPEQRFAVFGA